MAATYLLQQIPRWRWLQNQIQPKHGNNQPTDNILRQEILLFYLLPTLPTPKSLCVSPLPPPQKKHTHFLSFKKNHHLDLDGSGEPPKRVPLLRDQGSSHQPLTKRSPVQQHGLHPLCHSGRRKVGGALSVFRCQKLPTPVGLWVGWGRVLHNPDKFGDSLDKWGEVEKFINFFLWNGIFVPFHKQNLSQAFCAHLLQPGERCSRRFWH